MRQQGFSYLLLLFAVAALGFASAGSALMWSTLAQTERERELLFIGGEFSRALQRYFDASPVEPKRYPATLQELVEDKRQPMPLRHLRKIYFDPMTRNQDWGLVISGGQIRAIYSKSEKLARITVLPVWVDATGEKVPDALKSTAPGSTVSPSALPATSALRDKASERRYADWLFVPMPTDASSVGAAGASGAPAGGSALDAATPSGDPGRSMPGIGDAARDESSLK